jgi:hypothetical protein
MIGSISIRNIIAFPSFSPIVIPGQSAGLNPEPMNTVFAFIASVSVPGFRVPAAPAAE